MVIREKSVLSGAIKDLENEIKSLGKDKASIRKSIDKLSLGISESRKKELLLQKSLATIHEKEAKLIERKKSLESKSDKVSDKLGKMSKIRSEMKDI
jgi:phage shock protein A